MTENIIMMIVWLTIFVIAIIAEIITTELVSVWFCIGAIVALACTFIPNMPWWGELIIFFGVSIIALIALRPVARRTLQRNKSNTNVDELIGKKGKVIKDITSLDSGEINVNGTIWTAIKRDEDETIKEGEVVKIISITGNKLLVEEIKKEEK